MKTQYQSAILVHVCRVACRSVWVKDLFYSNPSCSIWVWLGFWGVSCTLCEQCAPHVKDILGDFCACVQLDHTWVCNQFSGLVALCVIGVKCESQLFYVICGVSCTLCERCAPHVKDILGDFCACVQLYHTWVCNRFSGVVALCVNSVPLMSRIFLGTSAPAFNYRSYLSL
jgi:hypothetical protein